jgi:hypothetical protein
MFAIGDSDGELKGGRPFMKTPFALRKVAVVALFGALVVPAMAPAQNSADPLEQGFLSPPSSARPRVWWHWMSGNITQEGIGLDMEWMKRVGLGGMQNFDAALNTPKVVEKRLVYMTPEWKDAFLSWPRTGHRRVTRVERDRGALGRVFASDEEVCLE